MNEDDTFLKLKKAPLSQIIEIHDKWMHDATTEKSLLKAMERLGWTYKEFMAKYSRFLLDERSKGQST